MSSSPPPSTNFIPLLDEEGALTPAFEAALSKVFLRYATPTPNHNSTTTTTSTTTTIHSSSIPDIFSNERTMNRADLDKFSIDTNGQRTSFLSLFLWGFMLLGGPMADLVLLGFGGRVGTAMGDETFDEITEFFDLVEEDVEGGEELEREGKGEGKRLTFKGFLQLYQLQTENDLEETENDLTAWGFGPDLELVTSRKEESEEVDEEVKVPLEELTGLGQGGEKKWEVAS